MGNIIRKFQKTNYELQDQRRLLLCDDMEERFNNIESSITQKYSQIIQNYNYGGFN